MDKIIYISLGHNCTPANHYVKNKIMNSKKEGRKSCPFDLAISTYTGLCKLFENDFESFLDIELINNPRSDKFPRNVLFYSKVAKKPYGDNLIINKKCGLYFNHESPGHPFLFKREKWSSIDMFTKNDFELFKKRYENRIDNLKNYINDSILNKKTIIFLLYTNVTPYILKDIIIKKYPGLNFKISCQQINKSLVNEINLIEKYIFDYIPLNEKPYNANYKDKNIIMGSWHNIHNLVSLEL